MTPSLREAIATKQSTPKQAAVWIASRSLSSGAHSRDPLARNDENEFRLRPIDLTGKSPKVCPALRAKIFRFCRRANH
jgi:hypothetical protein